VFEKTRGRETINEWVSKKSRKPRLQGAAWRGFRGLGTGFSLTPCGGYAGRCLRVTSLVLILRSNHLTRLLPAAWKRQAPFPGSPLEQKGAPALKASPRPNADSR
jgi:hypothetical protein